MKSSSDVLARARENTHGRWNDGPNSAATRIAKRVVVPQGRQSFVTKPGDTFFAIGSCFARNVEERLEMAGATVTSRRIDVRDLGDGTARAAGVFNKYTPVSILQELKWAAGREPFPQDAFLRTGNGWYDPFLSSKAGYGTPEELMARREEIAGYFAQVFQADIVILTLGLIESWFDRETGLALNEAPNPRLLKEEKRRFYFKCLSFEHCEAALDEIRLVLKAHGKPGQKVILTVSPVPLGRTFTNDDVIVANTMSKSTLRVAAQRLVARARGVDYFPSYEAVLHSDPSLCWQRDRRHVSDVIVGHIVQTFLTRYGVSPEDNREGPVLAEALAEGAFAPGLETGEDDQALLLARMNQEVNRYKNMVIRLQAELRKAQSRMDQPA